LSINQLLDLLKNAGGFNIYAVLVLLVFSAWFSNRVAVRVEIVREAR